MYAALNKAATVVAKTLALLGGAVLIGLILLTCLSIFGRALGLGTIRGIYDVTEIGIATSVFAFLPWCQLKGGHATVELFAPMFGRVFNNVLTLIFDAMMLFIMVIGTWRLYLGMLEKHSYGETTLIAQIPLWQGYAACMLGAAGCVLVAAFCALRSLARLAGRTVEEANHV
jgi:TRAP-type C4-dicarboxylate transport system permease small subunit